MTEYKTFAPITAVIIAGTVFYQHATHHHEYEDASLLALGTPLPDDAERRMPKWPDQARNPATSVSTGSMTVTSFGGFDKA